MLYPLPKGKSMIKDKKQSTTEMGSRQSHSISDDSSARFIRIRWGFFRSAFKPTRRGLSQQVLDTADQMIKEYQPDLEYLKDK